MHVGCRHPAIVKVLIEHGADINARDDTGFTPLHWAVGRNAPETARLLVESGADVNAKTNEGKTPRKIHHWLQRTGRAHFLTRHRIWSC